MSKEKVAVVPLVEIEGELKVVLVTSRATGRWILPKGNLEPDLALHKVAAMEAWEEAGVRGSIKRSRSQEFEMEFRGESTKLTCFLMDVDEVAESWPEDHQRERRIAGQRKASKLLRDTGFSRILEAMLQLV